MGYLQAIFDQLTDLEPTPLILAVLLSGAIGFERELHGRPAGLRTHILVCLASTVLIYVSRHLHTPAPDDAAGRLVLDPTRLAAGIVTGIGFLGAASVVRSGDMVRGVTTGACIWSVAALGVVIGYEAYGLAVATTVIVLLVLVVLDWGERWISPVIYRRLIVLGRSPEPAVLLEGVRALLRSHDVRIQDFTGRLGAGEPFELNFHVRCRNNLQTPQVLEEVAKLEGVETVEWVTGGTAREG